MIEQSQIQEGCHVQLHPIIMEGVLHKCASVRQGMVFFPSFFFFLSEISVSQGDMKGGSQDVQGILQTCRKHWTSLLFTVCICCASSNSTCLHNFSTLLLVVLQFFQPLCGMTALSTLFFWLYSLAEMAEGTLAQLF